MTTLCGISLRGLVLAVAATFGAMAIAVLPAAGQEDIEPRFALVIGNSAYEAAPLRNPQNDARAIASVLRETGFEVTLEEDLAFDKFETTIDAFVADLPKGLGGLFYYAGHAFRYDGRNYLLPTDMEVGNAESMIDKALAVDRILTKYQESGAGLSIFILDACRDNPFDEVADVGKGLAFMEGTGGEVVIGFATQAGQVAFDGTGINSPYTGALISAIEVQGREISDVFRAVRSLRCDGGPTGVSGRTCRPRSSTSSFSGRAPRRTPRRSRSPRSISRTCSRRFRESGGTPSSTSQDPTDFDKFLRRFPASNFSSDAESRRLELGTRGITLTAVNYSAYILPEDRQAETGLSNVVTPCDVVASTPTIHSASLPAHPGALSTRTSPAASTPCASGRSGQSAAPVPVWAYPRHPRPLRRGRAFLRSRCEPGL